MSDSAPVRRRFQFGLRALLITVTVLAAAIGWFGHLHRQAQKRSALVAELNREGLFVDLEEPNGLGQLIKKFLPQREAWIREQIGVGWLVRPTVFGCWKLEKAQVPPVVERLKRLGTVRELQLRNEVPTEVEAGLRTGLPGIDVVNVAPWSSGTYYYRSRVGAAHFAYEGVGLLALIALVSVGAMGLLVWSRARRRKGATVHRPNSTVQGPRSPDACRDKNPG